MQANLVIYREIQQCGGDERAAHKEKEVDISYTRLKATTTTRKACSICASAAVAAANEMF